MLEITGLSKSFGHFEVVRGVDLRLDKGERRVLLGANGAGKTTLFNLIAGDLRPDAGMVRLDGVLLNGHGIASRARLGVGRSYQQNNLFDNLSIGETLLLGVCASHRDILSWWRDAHSDAGHRAEAMGLAESLGLADQWDMAVSEASYGVCRAVEIGLALASRPRLLLLDEPSSGVGAEMLEGLAGLIDKVSRDVTMLIIEHDFDLGFRLADRITVLDQGRVVFEGTPEETRASSLVRRIYLGSDWDEEAA